MRCTKCACHERSRYSDNEDGRSLKHHGDKLGLYTEQEEKDFEHVSNLKHYKVQITASLTHAICNQDDHCDLNSIILIIEIGEGD